MPVINRPSAAMLAAFNSSGPSNTPTTKAQRNQVWFTHCSCGVYAHLNCCANGPAAMGIQSSVSWLVSVGAVVGCTPGQPCARAPYVYCNSAAPSCHNCAVHCYC